MVYSKGGLPTTKTKNHRRNQVQMKLDTESLAHTKWECKYHIVFAPKYRRQIIYGKNKSDIGQMLRKLCEYKGIEIIEAEACKDHIHMLVSIPPKYSVSQIMGYLKGKSSLMIYEKYPELKYKYRNREFWCRVLCRHSRKECKKDRRIYPPSVGRGQSRGTTDDAEFLRKPVHG